MPSYSTIRTSEPINWAFEQSKDPNISKVISILQYGSHQRGENIPKMVKSLLRDMSRLIIENGVLYRTATVDGQPVRQLILPASHQTIAFQGVHDQVGHPGHEKSLWLARHRFYWPGMEADFKRMIS